MVRHDGRLCHGPHRRPGVCVHLLTPDLTNDAGVRNDESVDAMLETLARIRTGPDDGFRAVLHAAHGFTGSEGSSWR